MQVFDPVAHGNDTDTANDCQMMNYSPVERNLNRNDDLNLNLE